MNTNPRRDAVLQLLESYPSDDGIEREHVGALQSLLSRPDRDAFARASFVPGHITASAFVLSPDRSELLMIYHGKLHRWLQPGGHVEADDVSVEAAAVREVREETGLALPASGVLLDIDVHPIPAYREDPAHLHYDIRYLLQATVRDGVLAGDDAADARWVPLTEVRELASDASILRPVDKIRRGVVSGA